MSIILYAHGGFKGRERALESSIGDLRSSNFNDKASSVKVQSGTWKLWEHVNFTGRCYQVGPGDYDIGIISAQIGNDVISSVELVPKIILYEHGGFKGRERALESSIGDLRSSNFTDKASSVKVQSGTWKLWEHINFTGRCYQVGPGDYDIGIISAQIGNDVISSVELVPKIILYAHGGFKGRERTLESSIGDLRSSNFTDKASSVKVQSGTWKLWEHINFTGRCYQVGPGDYDIGIISAQIGNDVISSVELVPKIILYAHGGFKGRERALESSIGDLRSSNFTDKASSVKVQSGTWKLWEHVNFTGRCYQVGPGDYDIGIISAQIGNDVISSVELVPKIILYEHGGFKGRERALESSIGDLRSSDTASSVKVQFGTWKLWEHVNFTGRCYQVGPGDYDIGIISAQIGNDVISSVELVPKIILYEHGGFKGRERALESSIGDLRSSNFTDKVSSVKVQSGTWKLWEHINFTGRCYQVGPGDYDIGIISAQIGNDVISSVELVPKIILYEHGQFKGRELALESSISDLRSSDTASSVKVQFGTWKLWEHVNFTGRCYQVGPGDYDIGIISAQIGNDVISSVEKL